MIKHKNMFNDLTLIVARQGPSPVDAICRKLQTSSERSIVECKLAEWYDCVR